MRNVHWVYLFEFMLTDFTYNLGRLSKYPKFADAIVTGNTNAALEHYIRKDEPGGSELGRNDDYLSTYLQPWIDLQIQQQKEEAERRAKELQMQLQMQEQFIIPADNTGVGNNPLGGWKQGGELKKM